MEKESISDYLQDCPVIAAIKRPEELEACLTSECRVVFFLFGDVMNISGFVSRAKAAGKLVLVHIDLIEGLAARDVAVDFISTGTDADGIISTRVNLLRRARQCGLYTVQRFFVLDSLSLENISKQFPLEYADAIEILPGVMPKIIHKIASFSHRPVIAGGLISDKEDVMNALRAGAISVSTTNPDIWFL
ncbi:glycerol-3-phosphate responsive antiterminator [Anaerotruncus sp. AF02-27]|uniref:glycerol-3-phosphate responsive antiterminator n=1 Tax=Anaerotruncus sp. AF02-27 TaxID=2292191 RepID=UPI000E53FDEC|nr:glycerol-3-phosphate responsive antiterminator [Anaerotruncus sp. AF02-27]RGX56817.1 glycerol-3-phosphate responsive antiterminator [Anaerotruncus sp. AF02-27]